MSNDNSSRGEALRSEEQLKILRDLLNDPNERHDPFRKLVGRLFKEGTTAESMLKADKDLWFDAQRVAQEWKPYLRFVDNRLVWSVNVISLDVVPSDAGLPRSPEQWAIRHFALLLLNPQSGDLQGPCPRCGNYFVKRRKTKNCLKRCSIAAAVEATRRAEHEALMEPAQRFVSQWTPRKHPIRAVWVAARVNSERKWIEVNGKRKIIHRNIDRRWITRHFGQPIEW
jgi:hypothetical protein